MNDVHQQLRARIEGFVSEIAELVRQATLESVYATLGAVETRARGGSRVPADGRSGRDGRDGRSSRGGRGSGNDRRGQTAQPFASAPRRRGGKRSSDEIESMSTEILNHIKQNPGQGVEQISAALGISSKELTLPIRKLVAQADLRTEGQKRATKYFSGGSRPSGGKAVGRTKPVAAVAAAKAPGRRPASAAKGRPAPKKKARGRRS